MEHVARNSTTFWARPLLLVGIAALLSACQSMKSASKAQDQTIPWTASLPSCPCRQPRADLVGDGWAMDAASYTKKHPGAAMCYRSYPTVRTGKGRAGQQCCYDASGSLITSGSGAGTPDLSSSCRGEKKNGKMKVRLSGFIGHVFKDVRPWSRRLKSWQRYHTIRPPDNSNGCSEYHVTQGDDGFRVTWKSEPISTLASNDSDVHSGAVR